MVDTHKCKWCGSDNCDAIVTCDLCCEDISCDFPRYMYLPDHMDADDTGHVRVCSQCARDEEFETVLAQISV